MDKGATIFLLAAITLINVVTPGYGRVDNLVGIQAKSFLTDPHSGQDKNELPIDQPTKTSAPVSQEESEDDDDSASEKYLQRVSLATLTHFLELLYALQHSLFQQLDLEIKTPPPKIAS